MSKWIKKGIPVVHFTNLEVMFVVDEFMYQSGIVLDMNQEKVRKNLLVGIRCKRVDDDGRVDVQIFHSKDLIPKEVADKGPAEAYRFYSREGIYKNW